jgi:hypothetical protein
MTAQLSPAPVFSSRDNLGFPLVGGKLFTYVAGTTTPQATYVDSTQTTPNTNPVILNYRGEAFLWLDPTLGYKFVLQDAFGNLIWTEDNIPGSAFASAGNLIPTVTNAFSLGSPTRSWAQLYLGPTPATAYDLVTGNIGYYARTTAEASAAIVAFSYPPQTATRYATNTAPGITDMASGIQAAIDSASQSSAEVKITDLNGLSKPLLLRSTTQQNIALIGNGSASTILLPLAVDIHQSPQNINALIINQNNNDHFHLSKLRCFANNGFTGQLLYCKAGGGADGSAQTWFSGVIEDCFFGFGTANSGVFDGGFNNLQVINCDFESTKTGCFILEGAVGGASVNADLLFANITMSSCFDSFIYANGDTTLKVIISVNGLHAYGHLRGPLISITKGIEMAFQDIILEPAIGNFGTTGLFQFTDCTDVVCSNFIAGTANSEPKCAIGINIINGFTGKFSNGKVSGTVGLQVSGTGTLDLTVDNVDFIGCDTAFQMLSGTLGGVIYFRQCRLNNNQLYGLITLAGTATFDLTLEDCEIINCGLNSVVTNRNVNISTSGAVRLIRCKIGQNNGSAAAADYIFAGGSGTFQVIDPIPVGVPPTAFVDGTSTNAVLFDGIDSTMPGFTAAMSLTPGGSSTLTAAVNRWTLKGRVVHFFADITINTIGTGSTIALAGLPFTSSATAYGGGVVHFFSGAATAVTSLTVSVAPASSTVTFRTLVAAAVATGSAAILANGTRVIIEGSYPL